MVIFLFRYILKQLFLNRKVASKPQQCKFHLSIWWGNVWKQISFVCKQNSCLLQESPIPKKGHWGMYCCKCMYIHINWNRCSPIYSICFYPCKAVFIDPEHQLQTSSNTLYILGTLGEKNNTPFLIRRVR